MTGPDRRAAGPRRVLSTLLAILGGVFTLAVGVAPSATAAPGGNETGFALPFSGAPAFERFAPPKLTKPSQLNQPMGLAAADRVAAAIGLSPKDALSEQQYRSFLSGGGIGGSRDAAKIIDACLIILTNTTGRPMFGDSVVGSYGLYVNEQGMLQSPRERECAHATGQFADRPPRRLRRHVAARQRGDRHPAGALPVGLHDRGPVRLCRTTDVGRRTVGDEHQGRRHDHRRHVDGAAAVDRELRAALHRQAVTRRCDARLLGAIPPPVAVAIKASPPNGQVPYSRYASHFG